MKILKISEENNEIYNAFVAQNSGSFLQSYEWGQWLASDKSRTVSRYAVSNNVDAWLVSAQTITTLLPLGQYYIYIPYGPVFQKDLHQNRGQEALDILLETIRAQHPKALFIRIEPTSAPTNPLPGKKSVNIQPGNTILTDLTHTETELLASMHPKTRYSIRVAERRGVVVRNITSAPDKTSEAAHLFEYTLTRRRLVTQRSTQHEQLVAFFNQQAGTQKVAVHIFGAYLQEQLLAAALMVDFAHTRTYLFGGSDMEHKNVMAPYLLHWYIIKDAKTKGLTTYDWYGGESSTGEVPGFVRFKLRFGGTVVQYQGVHDIVLHPILYRLYTLTRTLNRWIKHL